MIGDGSAIRANGAANMNAEVRAFGYNTGPEGIR
jgi:hypothetical protein